MPKFPNNPRVLKAKLSSYETFYGIAHSIQLVAFSKLKKVKKKIDSRFVSLRFLKLFLKNYYLSQSEFQSKYFLLFLFTSDKSCAGSINNPIIKKATKLYLKLKSSGSIVSLIPVGKKGYYVLRRKFKRDIKSHFADLESDMSMFVASYFVVSNILNNRFDDCYLIFAQFVNNFLQQIVYIKFPSFSNFVSITMLNYNESNPVLDIFLTKNLEDRMFASDFYFFFISLLMLDSFEESDYSQLGAKAKTMELAIQNVGETITILRIKYNKCRQSIITNEIIEILNASIAILE